MVSGQPYIGPGLGSELLGIKAPIHFLDFETFGPAQPLYDSTCPYQTIPFQWSLHVLDSQEELRHQWFFHDDVSDPREAFVSGLLDAMGPQGSIVVYSPYEKTILNQLAQLFPQHERSLSGESGYSRPRWLGILLGRYRCILESGTNVAPSHYNSDHIILIHFTE